MTDATEVSNEPTASTFCVQWSIITHCYRHYEYCQ